MTVTFPQVKLHDIIDLPGRKGEPDRYIVTMKRGDRIKLESKLQPGQIKYMTSNQFDDAGFELRGSGCRS